MSDVVVKDDLKFSVALLFDVIVPSDNFLYDTTVAARNDNHLKVDAHFRDTLITALNLRNELQRVCARNDSEREGRPIVITLSPVQ